MVEFRDTAGTLIAGCLVDRLANGLSAIYSFFASDDDHRSLGTMMVLWLIARATAEELPYVHLGYWVEQSSKMTYKTRLSTVAGAGTDGLAVRAIRPTDRPSGSWGSGMIWHPNHCAAPGAAIGSWPADPREPGGAGGGRPGTGSKNQPTGRIR